MNIKKLLSVALIACGIFLPQKYIAANEFNLTADKKRKKKRQKFYCSKVIRQHEIEDIEKTVKKNLRCKRLQEAYIECMKQQNLNDNDSNNNPYSMHRDYSRGRRLCVALIKKIATQKYGDDYKIPKEAFQK